MGDLDVIVRDPAICGEEPTNRGTRVTLRTILASLAEGDDPRRLPDPDAGRYPGRHTVRRGLGPRRYADPRPAEFALKIKLDENSPASLAGTLHALGHDVDTVPEEGLAGFPDP